MDRATERQKREGAPVQHAAIEARPIPRREEARSRSTIRDYSVAETAPEVQLARFDHAIGALHAAVASANRDIYGASGDGAVQRKADAHSGLEDREIQAAAAHGVQGSGGPLPHQARIQQAFGAHDISGVDAHVGGAASDAATSMGAEAYATGSSVAFRQAPSLHTAAHEAAHVVQQRAGVSLKGGVGQAGDTYERHADAVADAVVAGRSAEALLGPVTAAAGMGEGVQRSVGEAADKALSLSETFENAKKGSIEMDIASLLNWPNWRLAVGLEIDTKRLSDFQKNLKNLSGKDREAARKRQWSVLADSLVSASLRNGIGFTADAGQGINVTFKADQKLDLKILKRIATDHGLVVRLALNASADFAAEPSSLLKAGCEKFGIKLPGTTSTLQLASSKIDLNLTNRTVAVSDFTIRRGFNQWHAVIEDYAHRSMSAQKNVKGVAVGGSAGAKQGKDPDSSRTNSRVKEATKALSNRKAQQQLQWDRAKKMWRELMAIFGG